VPTQRCIRRTVTSRVRDRALQNTCSKISAEDARVNAPLAIPKDQPGALTSDVVVTADEVTTTARLGRARAREARRFSHVRFVDERPKPRSNWRAWPRRRGQPRRGAVAREPADATHWFVKAIRIAVSAVRWQLRPRLSPIADSASAHRGLNEVNRLSLSVARDHKRIPFPPMRAF